MRNKKRGVTVLEAVIAALISSVILTGLFFALRAGELSQSANILQMDVQAEVRMAVDWVLRDVRQTVLWDIADAANDPTATHIKFRQVVGWDTSGSTFLLSSNYIEYTFSATERTITRTDSATGNSWVFHNINASPFKTFNGAGALVDLNSADLNNSKVLVVQVSGQKQSGTSLSAAYTLTAEVKIRNG